jgi:glycerol-3-phosphate dehydrogenase subunit C
MSEDTKAPPREGSLDAPFRRPILWRDDEYYDLDKVHAELQRQFDVCHTCRRCFNLCDSFPRMFDAIDEGPTGEVDGIGPKEHAHVAEACTLCDMCFLTKCPYVPPHPFDIDIPHLILRYRAAKRRAAPRNGCASSWARPIATEGDQARGGAGKLGDGAVEHAAAQAAGLIAKIDARGGAAEVPLQDRGDGLKSRCAQPAGPPSASEGRALCDLLRRLQQARHRRGRGPVLALQAAR